jgi:hypothetical protein
VSKLFEKYNIYVAGDNEREREEQMLLCDLKSFFFLAVMYLFPGLGLSAGVHPSIHTYIHLHSFLGFFCG